MNKINRNVERDADNISKLSEMGWIVIVVWECELKKDKRDNTLSGLVLEIERQIDSSDISRIKSYNDNLEPEA